MNPYQYGRKHIQYLCKWGTINQNYIMWKSIRITWTQYKKTPFGYNQRWNGSLYLSIILCNQTNRAYVNEMILEIKQIRRWIVAVQSYAFLLQLLVDMSAYIQTGACIPGINLSDIESRIFQVNDINTEKLSVTETRRYSFIFSSEI